MEIAFQVPKDVWFGCKVDSCAWMHEYDWLWKPTEIAPPPAEYSLVEGEAIVVLLKQVGKARNFKVD